MRACFKSERERERERERETHFTRTDKTLPLAPKTSENELKQHENPNKWSEILNLMIRMDLGLGNERGLAV